MKQKLRVAHVVSTFPPYKGGIGNVCKNQVEGLAKRGWNVDVIIPSYKNEIQDMYHPAKYRVIKKKSLLTFGNASLLPNISKEIKEYDIVHIHYPFIGLEFLYLYLLLDKKVRIILQYQMDLVGRKWVRYLFWIYKTVFTKLIVMRANKVLVSTWDYFEHSDIYKYYSAHENKFIPLANGVDINKFREKEITGEIVEKIRKDKKKIVLFVGGLDEAHYFKGLDVLLNAMKELPEAKLIIVGKGNLQSEYEEQSNKLALKSRVFFLNKVDNDTLIDIYNVADVLVLPSTDKTEAYGLVTLEAMACGTPVITSDLPGVRTLINTGKDGLTFRVGNDRELAKKIRIIINNEELKKEYGANGKKKVVKHFSWDVIVDKLVAIYNAT